AGAGDIACGVNGNGSMGSCAGNLTGDLIQSWGPQFVWTAGDVQYAEFPISLNDYMDPTFGFNAVWGRFNPILHPAVGNHEDDNGDSVPPAHGPCTDDSVPIGYWDYFNGRVPTAGTAATDLYYSFDVQTSGLPWHVVVLDMGKCYNEVDGFWCTGYTG